MSIQMFLPAQRGVVVADMAFAELLADKSGHAPEQTAPLFDHLIGADEEGRRQGDAAGR